MSFPLIRTAFVAGEISPELYGHVDIEKFGVAATTLRNMAVSFKGGSFSRPGTKYCLLSGTQYSTGFQPRVMRYQFNTQQGYCIEAGPNYFRFFQNGAPILEKLEKVYAGKAAVVFLDVWEDAAPAKHFGIRAIPTLIIFKGGQVVEQITGAVSRSIIENALKKAL